MVPINDLTDSYVRHYLERGDRRAYEATDPDLFEHYYSCWADPQVPPVRLGASELIKRKESVLKSLERIMPSLRNHGLEPSGLELTLMIGQNSSNGHAYVKDRRFLPWIAVECYTSPKLADIFVTHEIIHACHYQKSPDFFFFTRSEKDEPFRQLVTEGLATWLTSEVLGLTEADALWADYWPAGKVAAWMTECEQSLARIYHTLAESVRSGQATQLFVLADDTDILKSRAGYFAGLRLMKSIAFREKLKPLDLLSVSRERLQSLCLPFLES